MKRFRRKHPVCRGLTSKYASTGIAKRFGFFRFNAALRVLAIVLCVSAVSVFGQAVDLPAPQLRYVGFQDRDWNGQTLRMYKFEIKNRSEFPAELFDTAPDLPPCGLNYNSSRTWVYFFDAKTKARLYGFCGMKDSSELGKLWFSRQVSASQPKSVYIEMTDRRTGSLYRSNEVNLSDAECAEPTANDHQEINRLEIEWNRINEASDPEAKMRLLAPDSYHIGPSGRYYNKQHDVAAARASREQKDASGDVTTFIINERRVRMYADVAVATGHGYSVVTKGGQNRTGGQFRFVHVWQKRAGEWQLVVDQVTAIQSPSRRTAAIGRR
jgi:ketosteroid isomerase-like protein